MLTADELVQGNCYFTVMFYDEDLSIPHVRTYVYIGKNLLPKKSPISANEWIFQDPQSYTKHGSFLNLPRKIKRELFIVDEDTLDIMYDINGLITKLSRLSKEQYLPEQRIQKTIKGKPKIKRTPPTPTNPSPSNQITRKNSDRTITISTPAPTKKVLREYEKAIIKYPESAELRLHYALALRSVNNKELATEQIRDAIRLKPGEHYPHSVLADLLMDAGDIRGSIVEKRKALRLILKAGGSNQSEVISRWSLAEALRKNNRTREARSELLKAVKMQRGLVKGNGSSQLLGQLEELLSEYKRKGY
jgi:tetratricopeptide (TPR) repeat protein